MKGYGNNARRRRAVIVSMLTVMAASVGIIGCGSSSSNNASADTQSGATSASDASSSAGGAGKSPFHVLAILPMSGQFAAIGTKDVAGARAAVNIVNGQGGILGHPVTLKVVDDAGDGSTAVSALQQALASGTQYNAIGPDGTLNQEIFPLAAALRKTPVLQVTAGADASLNNYPYLYQTSTGFTANEESMMARLKQDGISRFAILCGDDATGQTGAHALSTAAKQAGLTVTATVCVPDGATDATPQLQQAAGSGAQAFAVAGFTPATPAILKARTKLGLKTPVYLDSFAAVNNFGATNSPADLKGVWIQDWPYLVQGDPATQTPTWQAFHTAFAKLYPHSTSSIFGAVLAYDSIMLMRAAATKAHSTDAKSLASVPGTITTSTEVPGWIGPQNVYTQADHALHVQPSDLKWYKAGPQVNGLLVPGT